MKLQALATLASVVKHGSFAAAAVDVNLVPSAVSLQMKQLESWFGQPLFDRSGRSVQPTAFAHEVARTVQRSLAEIESLRRSHGSAPSGRVRLGITESAQTTLLPLAYKELQRRAPGVELHIARGSTPDLLADLKAARIDVAVLIRPLSGGSSRLLWTELSSERMTLVVPADLPAAPVRHILRDQPWIRLDRRLVAGQMAARFVEAACPQRRALLDLAGVDAIVAMIGVGIGVSVLPKLRHEQLLAHAVREIGLGRDGPVRKVMLVRRRADEGKRAMSEVEAAFVQAVAALG